MASADSLEQKSGSARFAESPTDRITFRRVVTAGEYAACVRMQHAIWGDAFTETVPATILKVSQQIGGVTAGAFDAEGTLLGFVFGMTGVQQGRLVHWSDLLAVDSPARNKGLGRRLKMYQRELLIPLGVETMFWTYDPLVARNAYLNIVKLGARPAEYIVDMYGSETQSALHGALGTDRFVVAWDLTRGGGANGRSADLASGHDNAHADAPVVNSITREGGVSETPVLELVDAPVVRVEIPPDIEQTIAGDYDAAVTLREVTRRAFCHYMGRGYKVTAFSHLIVEDRYFYILSRSAA
jgi:predicted GNAT superfamily acetyltransferase